MKQQIWELTSDVTGNFIITSEDNLTFEKPPHPSIKKITLMPHFNDQGNQTGTFSLEIKLAIDIENEDKPSTYYVADIGRNAFNFYIEVLTFLSLSPVLVIKAPALTYNIPGTNQFRLISFPSEQATISHPLPISGKSFLSIQLNNEIRKIMGWLRIGLQEKDIITIILALFTCVEILSHQFENSELRISRTCSNCGFEEKIRLGTK